MSTGAMADEVDGYFYNTGEYENDTAYSPDFLIKVFKDVLVSYPDEILLDGGTIRYLAEPLVNWGGGVLREALGKLSYVKIIKKKTALNVYVYFDEITSIELMPKKTANRWQIYSLHFPKMFSFKIAINDGVVRLYGMDSRGERFRLYVKMPFMPDRVYLHDVMLDLANGDTVLSAGVMGNLVDVYASGRISPQKTRFGVDIKCTITSNLDLLILSVLALIIV
ncbi:MAG: hypothetical protein AAB116_05580 [Candidatus Poribacteria bacterium]